MINSQNNFAYNCYHVTHMDLRFVNVSHKQNHLTIGSHIFSMRCSIPSQKTWDMKGKKMVGFAYNKVIDSMVNKTLEEEWKWQRFESPCAYVYKPFHYFLYSMSISRYIDQILMIIEGYY